MEDLDAKRVLTILKIITLIIFSVFFLQLFICYGLYSIYTTISVVTPTAISSQTSVATNSVAETQTAPTIVDCPAKMVPIPDGNFCLDAYEVTNAEYRTCVEAGDCTPPQETTSWRRDDYYGDSEIASEFDDYPVIWVNWLQAYEYCNSNSVEKRLPTAAEWDIAAHAPDNYESWPSLEKITVYTDTQKVGSIGDISPEEVYDLAGNVREWVADADDQGRRMIKGKSVLSTSSDRPTNVENKGYRSIGFRCAWPIGQ